MKRLILVLAAVLCVCAFDLIYEFPENLPEVVEIPVEPDIADYPAYNEILEQYKQAYEEKWDREKMIDSGLNYMALDCENVKIGLADIDEDGIEEMVVLPESDIEFFNDMVFSLYKLDEEGKAVQVFNSGERDRYYLTETKNEFRHEGSSSAFDSFEQIEVYQNGEMTVPEK